MANCKSCGKSVGCGCQLTNGLCINCINAKKSQATQSQIAQPIIQDVKIEDFSSSLATISIDEEGKLVTNTQKT